MSFDLAVWHSETALSEKQAVKLYLKLCKQEWMPTEQFPGIPAFYDELCSRYPEIDTLSESELDRCPWSCAHDKSGLHMIMCMTYGDELEPAAHLIIELAAKHGLICFDPQGPNVHLPPHLMSPSKRSRFRFW